MGVAEDAEEVLVRESLDLADEEGGRSSEKSEPNIDRLEELLALFCRIGSPSDAIQVIW
jgi:hypothetical protein